MDVLLLLFAETVVGKVMFKMETPMVLLLEGMKEKENIFFEDREWWFLFASSLNFGMVPPTAQANLYD